MHNAKPIPILTDKQLRLFWDKVHLPNQNGCMEWGAYSNCGYGQFTIDGSKYLAHRIAYHLWVGPIPPGLVVDHTCRRTLCCAPNHLQAVPQKVNIARGLNHVASKMRSITCPQGHLWTPESTYTDKGGARHCRTCHRDRERARYHAKKESKRK